MHLLLRALTAVLLLVPPLLYYLKLSINIPSCFDDCYSYMTLMESSIFSADYWQIVQSMMRPFTIPFIFSLFGDFSLPSLLSIMNFQTLLSFAAWVALAASLARMALWRALGVVLFVVLALEMFARGYLNFNRYMLSDSLALSLILLWFVLVMHLRSICHWLEKKQQLTNLSLFGLALFAGITFLVVHARDMHAYLTPFAIIPITLLLGRHWRKTALALASIIVLISINAQIRALPRNIINLTNILAGVVLPDAEKTAFFRERSFPLQKEWLSDPKLTAKQELMALDMCNFPFAKQKVAARVAEYPALMRSIYGQYLLTHPAYTLGNSWRYREHIFNQQFLPAGLTDACDMLISTPAYSPVSTPPVHVPYPRLAPLDYVPLDVWAGAGLLSLLLCLAWARRHSLLLYGITFALGGFTNATLAFHGDLWAPSEMERHAFIGSIFFRLGCLLFFACAMDAIRNRLFSKTIRNT